MTQIKELYLKEKVTGKRLKKALEQKNLTPILHETKKTRYSDRTPHDNRSNSINNSHKM